MQISKKRCWFPKKRCWFPKKRCWFPKNDANPQIDEQPRFLDARISVGMGYTQGGLFFPCLNFIFLVHCFVRKEATKKKSDHHPRVWSKTKLMDYYAIHISVYKSEWGGGANV